MNNVEVTLRNVFDAIRESDDAQETFRDVEIIKAYAENGMNETLTDRQAAAIQVAATALEVALNNGYCTGAGIQVDRLVDAILESI